MPRPEAPGVVAREVDALAGRPGNMARASLQRPRHDDAVLVRVEVLARRERTASNASGSSRAPSPCLLALRGWVANARIPRRDGAERARRGPRRSRRCRPTRSSRRSRRGCHRRAPCADAPPSTTSTRPWPGSSSAARTSTLSSRTHRGWARRTMRVTPPKSRKRARRPGPPVRDVEIGCCK